MQNLPLTMLTQAKNISGTHIFCGTHNPVKGHLVIQLFCSTATIPTYPT